MTAIDGDLTSCLANNVVPLSAPIAEILATIQGANEGPAWHWLLMLEDGTFAYVTGRCDYTGWDCESSAEGFYGDTLKECLAQVPEAERGDFLEQLPEDARRRCA